jgi:DNA-binding response OmpR family regulator
MDACRVVVIEDERDIAQLVRDALNEVGFSVKVAHDGIDGLSVALEVETEMVVLDLMLPGMDGLSVCRRLRNSRPELLILMLTAKTSEFDRVLGLELGADDYIAKPFSLRELQARAKALVRRKQKILQDTVEDVRYLEYGPLTINVQGQEVRLHGKQIHVTQREFDLLLHFVQHPGQIYSRQELLDRIWGAGFDGFDHTVNSHINRLRAKIEQEPAHPRMIQTVWGRGYKFVPPE